MSTGESYIWLDGNFLQKDEAKTGLLTHGLHYGTGAFEGIRVYNGKIFKLEAHIARFFNSSKILLMEIPFTAQQLEEACLEIVKLNNITDGYIRPLIFLGDQRMLVGSDNNVHTMIACWPRANKFEENLTNKKSLKLTISAMLKPAPESFLYEAKASGLYILNHIAKKKALQAGFDDALMLDYRQYIAEATTSNFFMVKDEILYTPLPECCLKGVTRQVIIDLAKENNIPIIEKHLTISDLASADEAFLSGTVSEITAISSINEYAYGDNPVTRLLYAKFHQLISGL